MEKKCQQCGKIYDAKRRGQKFCSRSCANENRRKPPTEKTCEWCGDAFEVNLYKADTARFCSLDCLGKHNADVRSGEDSPRWRGGHKDYYGPNWDEQRQKRLEQDGFQCLNCGTEDELIVHHVTPYREYVNDDGTVNYEEAHRIGNLRTYCRTCHAKIENRESNEFGR